MVSVVVVMVNELLQSTLQLARQIIILQLDHILHGPVVSLDLSLSLRMKWSPPHMIHSFLTQEVGQLTADIA